MAKLNKVSIIGNLGKDPVLNTTYTSGKKVCNIRVAVNEEWTDKTSGQKVKKTEWFTVVCWNGLAEVVSKYTKSGSQVYVEGSLRTGLPYMSKAIGQDGNYVLNADGTNFMVQKTDVEIVATDVQFLGKKTTDTAYSTNGQVAAPVSAPVNTNTAPFVTQPVVKASPNTVNSVFVRPPAGV